MVRETSRCTVAFLLALSIGWALISIGASPASAAEKFKLKPGARGKVCLQCHDTFAAILDKSFVHTPVAKRDCTGCHSPHASDHAKLLDAESSEMCEQCHRDLIPQEVKSVHQVVADRQCTSCHDPHAADNKMNLVRGGSDLCFECHPAMERKIAQNERQHAPVSRDCLGCHTPHASAGAADLLKKEQPALCLDCHEVDAQSFKVAHKNYPVAQARCSACHDPHGSSTEGILFDNVHAPVADKRCQECHEGATSRTPFALDDTGYELCEGCHYEEVADIFNKTRVHWPVVDRKGCVNCHAPHASPADGLLKEPMLELCGDCHADTVARQERAQTGHPPVAEGQCTACHSPHSSNNLFLTVEDSTIELCGACHDWQTHSTHPIGEEILDPRNANVSLECSSCHRAHGTEYGHFMYFETTNEMCVQCHAAYRR